MNKSRIRIIISKSAHHKRKPFVWLMNISGEFDEIEKKLLGIEILYF